MKVFPKGQGFVRFLLPDTMKGLRRAGGGVRDQSPEPIPTDGLRVCPRGPTARGAGFMLESEKGTEEPPPPPPAVAPQESSPAGKRRVALFGHAGNAWCLYPTLIADV